MGERVGIRMYRCVQGDIFTANIFKQASLFENLYANEEIEKEDDENSKP